jgi:hypothetical protein
MTSEVAEQPVRNHDYLVDKARGIAPKSSLLILETRDNYWRLDLSDEKSVSLISLVITGVEVEFSFWATYPNGIPENLRRIVREMALFKYDVNGPKLEPNLIRRALNLVDTHPEHLTISGMSSSREMVTIELHFNNVVEAVFEAWDLDGRYILNSASKPLPAEVVEPYAALLNFASLCLLQSHTPRSVAYGSAIRSATMPPPNPGVPLVDFD